MLVWMMIVVCNESFTHLWIISWLFKRLDYFSMLLQLIPINGVKGWIFDCLLKPKFCKFFLFLLFFSHKRWIISINRLSWWNFWLANSWELMMWLLVLFSFIFFVFFIFLIFLFLFELRFSVSCVLLPHFIYTNVISFSLSCFL